MRWKLLILASLTAAIAGVSLALVVILGFYGSLRDLATHDLPFILTPGDSIGRDRLCGFLRVPAYRAATKAPDGPRRFAHSLPDRGRVRARLHTDAQALPAANARATRRQIARRARATFSGGLPRSPAILIRRALARR